MEFSNPFNNAKTPQEKKEVVMTELRNQANIQIPNAKTNLCQAINNNCFNRCVPKPGSSLSSAEESCLTKCMDKYMAAWNIVSRQYLAREQKEGNGGQY
ncbi:Tim10/DDP family zinc finger-domain-containing protein [Tirmania nivea]|nr:Tim10/DDP family zinc finger-domain-containing protein [Tirmania nivea]